MKVVLANTEDLQQKAFEIRQEVFVIEQRVDRDEEFDEFEEVSRHFVALDDAGRPIGAARWRVTDKGIKLERFAVKRTERGKGIGGLLVQSVLDDIKDQKGSGHYLYLHAQLPAVALYEKFDFQTQGEQFEECNIMHYHMFKHS
ncbi:GNAT family N-acetyltransferase [Marinoscillum furvescens]|uniref:Putative GNAT family N-acyltransferase n=1 Tax=Marinoscillum furvescens DSM 4134 TaxID=1122208 RepID=A0A3D9L2Y4_MARFU|nr:GNAT family N-acetyltransferase [Marinoscillum furvescens]RED97042.1 putative GNAT family N-acyltransferase [Marinoscillum furvescens DSM 4134]